jgi:hypothetical protein
MTSIASLIDREVAESLHCMAHHLQEDTAVHPQHGDIEPGGYLDGDYDVTHCTHGTYVGYPGGPDYMCGWCESGEEPPVYRYQLHLVCQTPDEWISLSLSQHEDLEDLWESIQPGLIELCGEQCFLAVEEI